MRGSSRRLRRCRRRGLRRSRARPTNSVVMPRLNAQMRVRQMVQGEVERSTAAVGMPGPDPNSTACTSVCTTCAVASPASRTTGRGDCRNEGGDVVGDRTGRRAQGDAATRRKVAAPAKAVAKAKPAPKPKPAAEKGTDRPRRSELEKTAGAAMPKSSAAVAGADHHGTFGSDSKSARGSRALQSEAHGWCLCVAQAG